MPKKKGFTGEKYKEEIMKVLNNQPFMSTNELAEALSMGDAIALKYLEILKKNEKVKLKKVGNRRFWYI